MLKNRCKWRKISFLCVFCLNYVNNSYVVVIFVLYLFALLKFSIHSAMCNAHAYPKICIFFVLKCAGDCWINHLLFECHVCYLTNWINSILTFVDLGFFAHYHKTPKSYFYRCLCLEIFLWNDHLLRNLIILRHIWK